MASASNISVAVEKAVHTAFAEVAQSIMDKHGIQVNTVSFDWLDISNNVKTKALVTNTNVDTTATYIFYI